MVERDDYDLLAEFARSGSETAFAALVSRHVNLVFSAALRFTRNPSHAEDISQAVFILLARKAAGLGRGILLSGWLYQTTRLTAANFVKAEARRQHRENETFRESTLHEPATAAGVWEQIAPLLDEAMGSLGETDRNAVVLRFFENKTAAEVAAALQLTEAAAHKRAGRALDKMRRFLAKRGVTLSGTLIAGAVAAHSLQAAPAGLTSEISATAATGSAAAASTLTLVKETSDLMAWKTLRSKICWLGMVAGMIALTCLTIVRLRADSLEQWNLRAPLPQGNDLQAVAFGNGLFVAVGGSATLNSTDGTNWSNPGFQPGTSLDAITFGNGLFVAVGGANFVTGPGVITTSSDGTNWTRQVVSTNEGINTVAYGGGKFVALGMTSGVWTSTNGIKWAKSVFPGNTTEYRYLAYGHGTFVSVGAAQIYVSPNGVSWVKAQGPLSQYAPNGVAFVNGTFLLAGQGPPGGFLMQSSDGASWTTLTTPFLGNSLQSVSYGNGTFVGVGMGIFPSYYKDLGVGAIATSPDGVTWTSQTTNLVSGGLLGTAYGNGVFVAVGGPSILTSANGLAWTPALVGTASALYGVAAAPGLFTAVGDSGTIETSPDGVKWTVQNLGTTNSLRGVAYGNGSWVGVGGSATTNQAVILTSSDGMAWANSAPGAIPYLSGVAFGNGRFVAVGPKVITTSPDAVNWSSSTPPGDLFAVTFGNGLFVAVGGPSLYSGTTQVMTSADGTNWTIRLAGAKDLATGQLAVFRGVAYGHGTFVAVGGNGALYNSVGGITWTENFRPAILAGGSAVAYGAGNFFVTGAPMSSSDGVQWSSWNPGTSQSLLGIAYGNGTFVAVGLHGTIIQSASSPGRPILAYTPAGASLMLSWPANFLLQAAPAVETSGGWSNLTTSPLMTNGQNTMKIDASAGSHFFRLISQ